MALGLLRLSGQPVADHAADTAASRRHFAFLFISFF